MEYNTGEPMMNYITENMKNLQYSVIILTRVE